MNLSFWRAVGILEKSCLSVHICINVYPFLCMCKQRDKHYLLSVHLFLAVCMLICIKKSVKSAKSAYTATVFVRFTVRRHHCGIHSGCLRRNPGFSLDLTSEPELINQKPLGLTLLHISCLRFQILVYVCSMCTRRHLGCDDEPGRRRLCGRQI